MKQNITLSIEKEIIKNARVLAAKRQTSISRMLGEELQKLIEDSKEYDRAKNQALNYIAKGFHMPAITPQFSFADLLPKTIYGFLIIVTSENSRTCHKDVCTGGSNICNRLFVNAAINLYGCFQIFAPDHLAKRLDFIEAVGNECLTAKSGVNTHNKHIIDIFNYPFQGLDRS